MSTDEIRPMTKLCTGTVPAKWGDSQWPCVRAAGHEGDCQPSDEWDEYGVPFSERDAAWLASEAGLLYSRVATAGKETRSAYAACQRDHGPILRKLIELVPHNTKRKTVPIEAVRAIWVAAEGREVSE